MKTTVALILLLAMTGCSESGFRKGHAGAQASKEPIPIMDEPAGAEYSTTNFKNVIVYGTFYEPPRNFESSVLNEPDEGATNDARGRGFRVNGSGYGFIRN